MHNIVGLLRDLSQYLGSNLNSYTSDDGITVYFHTSSFSDIQTTDTVIVDGLNAICKNNQFVIESDYFTTNHDCRSRTLVVDFNDDVFTIVIEYLDCDDIVQATVKSTIDPKYVAYFLDTGYKPL